MGKNVEVALAGQYSYPDLSVHLPLCKRGIEGDLFNKIYPNPSATAPCVALPPASMQSSFPKRGNERLYPDKGCPVYVGRAARTLKISMARAARPTAQISLKPGEKQ